jgi:hypothetical protein
MPFTGNEDFLVPIAEAAALNQRFRKMFNTQPKGVYISKKTICDILYQTDCVGIRFYFGLDTDNKLRLTYAGVLANENDILDKIGNQGILCPPSCGVSNVLNS